MIKVATRKSSLAEKQADIIIEMISDKLNLECEKRLYTTKGDRILDVSLDKIGGKGLFIKEIEIALLKKEADIAVHSLKDVPTELDDNFEIAAVPIRDDARDAFVSMNGLTFFEQRRGARIGTSSIRRAKQLLALRGDIEIVPIRGNVNTRIEKIERENLDGVVLAAAGLKRLGIDAIVTEYFDIEKIIPACGQGALCIETLKNNEFYDMMKVLNKEDIRMCVEAERNIMKLLNGGCHSLVAAYAKIEGDYIYIIGVNEKGGKIIKKDIEGKKENFLELSRQLAKKLC
ncbi:Porphobilinogen deaminase [Caloramator australicus RC3]|uniref:Porphobilinogen deaminase n=2 Tax=Clostridiaceae TaxID=31979 RepID=I7J5R2_9CLOT|nr:Porphobilinogen deaminase [Caloramator australicus RC3]